MSQELAVVIGMSVSYLFSIAGLILAWVYYKKYKSKNRSKTN